MSPAVSIIMPTFNRLEFIRPAVESVFAQTFTDWELIVADDGSDAATRSYLQTLADPPRVKVIGLPHSGKPSVARNAALRSATGEYVAFLDSDDLWRPQKLAAQIASLRRHTACKWSYTRFAVVDASGNPSSAAARKAWIAPAGWILEPLLNGDICIALTSVVVSRQLLERLGAFDEELFMFEDDELFWRLAAHSAVDGVDEVLTLKRRHGQHGGSDIVAWQDNGRVIEKALRASGGGHLDAILRRKRAEMFAGLANSQAASGLRWSALGTVFAGAPYSWRYQRWWLGALRAVVRAVVPPAVSTRLRRYRHQRRVRGSI